MEFSAQYIAECINGEVIGDSSVKITSVARIESGKEGNLVFLGNLKYEEYLYKSKASVVILNKSFEPSSPLNMTVIKVDDAYMAIASVLELFSAARSARKRGISLFSRISLMSKRGRDCYIGAGTVVAKRAKLGDQVQIYPQCYIGEEVEIGNRTIIYPGVKIYRGCKIGSDCIIHANAVIGADGFGFVPMPDGTFKKIPQTGNVVIEDSCEIGANTTIDRASIGSTIIRRGVKIDNLVQVAHNTEIGENTVIAAQAGISGSTKVGKSCMLGGQAGLSGHISIADKTMIGAQAGVISTIKEEGRSIIGSPAIDAKEYFKAYAIFRKLHKR